MKRVAVVERMAAPTRFGLSGVPVKSSPDCETPQTQALRLRAVRKSCSTVSHNWGESSKDQHSSRITMERRPASPAARFVVAYAISKLIAVSRRGSSFNCSMLKYSQAEFMGTDV